jgi:hypothetical protein
MILRFSPQPNFRKAGQKKAEPNRPTRVPAPLGRPFFFKKNILVVEYYWALGSHNEYSEAPEGRSTGQVHASCLVLPQIASLYIHTIYASLVIYIKLLHQENKKKSNSRLKIRPPILLNKNTNNS